MTPPGLAAPAPLSDSLSCLPSLNFADRPAEISIASRVLGLRPGRALRIETANLPNPEMFTGSPCLSASTMASSTPSTTRSASIFTTPSLSDKLSIRSALVIVSRSLLFLVLGGALLRLGILGTHHRSALHFGSPSLIRDLGVQREIIVNFSLTN